MSSPQPSGDSKALIIDSQHPNNNQEHVANP